MAENQIPATSLAGLEKFAGTVFDGSQGKYTLDEYAYFDDTSLFSTANFAAGAAIAAGVEQPLFTSPVGAIGQGYAAALTAADTNLERGADGGKFPANLAYVALAGGFYVYRVNAAGDRLPVDDPGDIFQITSNMVWSWNVGGESSPRLNYEPLRLWPSAVGVYSGGVAAQLPLVPGATPVTYPGLSNGGPVSTMRKFAFPLFFPPNVAVDCRVTNARQINFIGALAGAGAVRVCFQLRGYKLSRIV